MSKWTLQLAAIEVRHRAGERQVALGLLRKAMAGRVPREVVLPLASLARRAGAPGLGAQLLHSIVRPDKPTNATAAEQAEYAACLVRIGAEGEALKILETLNGKDYPQVLLFRAFALIPRWEYRQSIPLLESFIEHPKVSGEIRLVGLANLAAAQIAERDFAAAEKNVDIIFAEAKEKSLLLPLGVAHELSARSAVARHDWQEAEVRLSRVEAHFGSNDDIHLFFARKWRCFMALEKSPSSPQVAVGLKNLRAEAVKRGEWETVRECDRYEAVAHQEKIYFDRVMVGTPYPQYRRGLLNEMKAQFIEPTYYDWHPGEVALPDLAKRSGGAKGLLDLSSGEFGGVEIKLGQLFHRLLLGLSADFYRPLRLATFHSLVYPSQFFNPHSSPNRLHNAISRFNAWATVKKIPFGIHSAAGFYSLTAKNHARLRRLLNTAQSESEHPSLTLLRRKFGAASFTTQQAAAVLEVSRSAAQRLIDTAVKNEALAHLGAGRGARLKFLP